MAGTPRQLLRALRRPEHTGENRCVPCTAANVAIAAVLAGAAATVSLPLAAGVFAVSLAAIALRGYLVPYTPTLTKRYFPDRVLAWFDKHPAEPGDPERGVGDGTGEAGEADEAGETGEADPEAVLRAAGAVRECDDRDDLCLTDSFGAAWRERVDALDGHERARGDLADLLGVDAGRLELREYGTAFVAEYDGDRVGQWESSAAFVADLAAARELRDRYPDWRALPVEHRGQVLNGLRLFLEQCPECGGRVSPGRETVESCCRSVEVVATSCEACEARLVEIERRVA